MSSNVRNIPAFRPVPLQVLHRGEVGRRVHRSYARFYGRFQTMNGKWKHFGFQVRSDQIKNKHLLHHLIKATCNVILHNRIPIHTKGQIFENFGDVWYRTGWIEVRQIGAYKAGMHYKK